MSHPTMPDIRIEKISLEQVRDIHEAVVESGKEWFAAGMIGTPDPSLEELEAGTKVLLEQWDKDEFYMFSILDVRTNQILGFVFLNHVNRTHQIANLGYFIRTSRVGAGIATKAAKLAAQYGFEKLGFQRLEIVVHPDNAASLKVAEKTGAVREGLLRNRLRHRGAPCDAYMHSLIPGDIDIHNPA